MLLPDTLTPHPAGGRYMPSHTDTKRVRKLITADRPNDVPMSGSDLRAAIAECGGGGGGVAIPPRTGLLPKRLAPAAPAYDDTL